MTQEMLNEIDLSKVKKCFPHRSVLEVKKPGQPRTSSTYSIRVLCDPAMSDKETEYYFQSVREILPIKEFYSEEQGRDIYIYWHYNKNLPLTFSNP